MQLRENMMFNSRYSLVKLLGRGGFSEVWLVKDRKVNDKMMVIKVYAPGTGLDDDGVQIFKNEFSLVFDIQHTNLLKPTYFDIHNNMPYLVLPYCEQGSCSKLIGKITEKEVWKFLKDVSAGLAHLHAQEPPVIHQDIKPDNILIDNSGNYLITDFGISSKARNTLRRSLSQIKSSGGTIAYMAPEKFEKDNYPIKAGDIWALGVTAYELMTGDVPFGEHGGLIQKNGAEIPNIRGSWSDNLTSIVKSCLAKEPWDRPTAQDIFLQASNPGSGVKKKCWKCGKEISRNASFCSYCNASQNVVICPKCNKEITTSATFCPYCGNKK